MDFFDYVIVGGGSAGCVLANRLSARAANRVLLIESGIDTPPGKVPSDILDMFPTSALNPLYKWMRLLVYFQPVPSNAPERPPRLLYDQGHVLGGGSAINFQAANRGAPDDYDQWEREGAKGWAWRDVLPYFRKLESDQDFDGPLHGSDGPMPVRRVARERWSPFAAAVAEAMESAGMPFVSDQNGAFADGYFAATQSNKGSTRVSTAMAYLDTTTRARANLTILTEAHVQDILFEGRRATGVTLAHKGALRTVRAGEVVLATGAIHTPAFLMRCGIGPGPELARHGIDLRHELRGVGSGLQEHPAIPVVGFLAAGARHRAHHGPYLHLGGRYSSALDGCPPNDMYISVIGRTMWHAVGRRLGVAIVWVNKPFSRGRVTLASPRPEEEPVVEMNFLSDPRDLTRLMEATKFVAGLYQSPGLQGVTREVFLGRYSARAQRVAAVNGRNRALTALAGAVMDGPAALRRQFIKRVLIQGGSLGESLADRDRLAEEVRRTAIGVKHVSCTCKMGADDDPMAVTDADGRVRGLAGLRIVDASIFPTLPRANTNFPTIMVAEKIADRMLAAT